jgi:hypothetical protein
MSLDKQKGDVAAQMDAMAEKARNMANSEHRGPQGKVSSRNFGERSSVSEEFRTGEDHRGSQGKMSSRSFSVRGPPGKSFRETRSTGSRAEREKNTKEAWAKANESALEVRLKDIENQLAGGGVVGFAGVKARAEESAGYFTGNAWVNGTRYTGLNSHPDRMWVRVNVANIGTGNPVCEEVSDPPPVVDGAYVALEYVEYYLKVATYGDIHLTRGL